MFFVRMVFGIHKKFKLLRKRRTFGEVYIGDPMLLFEQLTSRTDCFNLKVDHLPMCVCRGGGRSSTAPLYIVKLIFTSNTRPQTYIHWSITGENRPLLLLVTESLLAPKKGAYNLTSVRGPYVRPYVRPSVDSDFSEVYGSTGLKL